MVDLDPQKQVRRRVPTLTNHADEIRDICPDTVNNFGSWSALKLMVHVATVNMYTTVISSYRDDWFYIDALAGSGVSVYGEEGEEECFLGSPVLAARDSAEQFTKMYFVEDCEEKANALERRLDAIFEGQTSIDVERPECGCDVTCADANSQLGEIKYDMWEVAQRGGKDPSFNYLSFIDNQGMNLLWRGIEEITPTPHGDLLINFPSGSINRPANQEESEEKMTEFYGTEIWKQDRTRNGLLDAYCRRLDGIERSSQVVTNIHSGRKNYQYDMIYATKEDAEYVQAIEYVRDFVEEVDGHDVEQLVDIVNGKQDTLIDLLPSQNGDDDSGEDGQTSLGEF